MVVVAVVQSQSSWGLWAAVTAVIIDSVVTCLIGWKLNRTARRETAKAAETMKPALNSAITEAIVTLLPAFVDTLKQHLAGRESDEQTSRTIRSISDKHDTF